MRTRKGVFRTAAAMVLGGALLLQAAVAASAQSGGGALDRSKMPPALRARVSGLLDLALRPALASGARNTRASNFLAGGDECNVNRGDNIKVNQNCLNVSDSDLQGRAQAQNETAIATDPNDSARVVSSYNDYRRGDATCASSYSRDGGRTWNDSTVPDEFTGGNAGNIQPSDFGEPREYWQAGGDTSVAWDSRGNVYLACQLLNRGSPGTPSPDLSSAFVIFRSTKNGGASWDFPGRYVIANQDVAGTSGLLEDKDYLAVDSDVRSPFRDRLYVTWTEFTPTSAYIYEAYSADYGETFSPKHLVSPAGTQSLCPSPVSPGGGCDNNQDSNPFVGPDGSLYVAWANYNALPGHALGDGDNGVGGGGGGGGAASLNGAGAAATSGSAPVAGVDNHQSILLARSTDGGNTFSSPVKVGDYFELPDCATYQAGQDAGRSCVPEKGSGTRSIFRATNYPSGAVNPRVPSQVIVSYGSYINRTSNEKNGCVPQGVDPIFGLPLYDGVKTPGACNNKIVVSVSNNGGDSFTGTTQNVRTLPVANSTDEQRRTDQWFQWLTVTRRGSVAISYYDRAYGDDETAASSDVSVSSASDVGRPEFDVKRVTSSSMPSPTEFPDGQGNSIFWGDYAGLAARGETLLPIWSDTRDADIFTCAGTPAPGRPPSLCGATEANGLAANDQDIFVAPIDASDSQR